MSFGAFFKALRLKTNKTLRQFCEVYGFDAGNISKLERDLLSPPQSREKLKVYAQALKIKPGDKAYLEFFDRASLATQQFFTHKISDQALLDKLPVLFRTLDNKELTLDKLNRIIALIKEEVKK